MTYSYKYPRPALTVDIAIFREGKDDHEILLIKRKNNPFKGMWALPGGFVDMDETVETAASRELFEETSLSGIHLEQFHVFSEVDRDPRGRTVSVVFTGLLKDDQEAKAKDDAKEARWFDLEKLPELAFDHRKIIDLLTKRRLS
ncbi:MAG: NUDIX hydrolase [Bacteroidetes bacterium]|nr:NUDIX hydrolase [Bacteroidota bacterium]